MGIDNLSKYALHFGLGKKTGIELPNEKAGAVASKDTYSKIRNGARMGPGDTLNAAIGQGDNNFTPMQIAKYISSIANGGTVVKPTIIKSVLKPDGSEVPKEEVENYANEKLGNEDTDDGIAINSESIAVAKEGMRMAASEAGGTAYNIFKNFITVCKIIYMIPCRTPNLLLLSVQIITLMILLEVFHNLLFLF